MSVRVRAEPAQQFANVYVYMPFCSPKVEARQAEMHAIGAAVAGASQHQPQGGTQGGPAQLALGSAPAVAAGRAG